MRMTRVGAHKCNRAFCRTLVKLMDPQLLGTSWLISLVLRLCDGSK